MTYIPLRHQSRIRSIESAMLRDNPELDHLTITIRRRTSQGIVSRVLCALKSTASPTGILLVLAGE